MIRPSATICCLPSPPCGRVACDEVDSAEVCRSFSQRIAPFSVDERLCNLNLAAAEDLPTWDDAAYPFLYYPSAGFVVMLVVWTIFSKIYGAAIRHPSFHKFVLNHVGREDQPTPRSSRFTKTLLFAQMLASILSLCMFIRASYQRALTQTFLGAQMVLGLWFTFHHLVTAMTYEFKVKYLLRLPQIIDIMTLPNMLMFFFLPTDVAEGRWVSLEFLRSVTALLAGQKLASTRMVSFARAPMDAELLWGSLRFLTLVVCFGSLILLLEILGELPLIGGTTVTTQMGDISFFTLVYWIIETISTVGYGDFAPKTFPSRLATITCMISGVAFFGIEVSRFIEIASQTKRGSGSYQLTWRPHIVLCGGGVRRVDATALITFLEEIYNTSYANQWPDTVMMTVSASSLERAREVVELSLHAHGQHRITYLTGSPLNIGDLQRCRCDTAKMVFFIADTSGSISSASEDKENILRALSLTCGYPKTPYRLMLLLPESKERALTMGIKSERCFSVLEMKYGLLYQACRCRGWSTLISNLMLTFHKDRLNPAHFASQPWLKKYASGVCQDLYGFLVAEKFHGKTFSQLMCDAYNTQGVCIIAAQIEGRIVLAPLTRTEVVKPETVCFAIAFEEDSLYGVALESEAVRWSDIFLRDRYLMYDRSDEASGKFAGGVATYLPTRGSFTAVSTFAAMGPNSGIELFEDAKTPLLSWESTPRSHRRLRLRRRIPTMSFDQGGEGMSASDLSELQGTVEKICSNAKISPFVLVLDLTSSWEQLAAFILQSRADYLPFHTPIVIVTASRPPKGLLADIGLEHSETLGIHVGSPTDLVCLVECGVKESSCIVCFGSEVDSREVMEMMDADVVMLHKVLDRIGMAQKTIVLEFKRMQNLHLMPQTWDAASAGLSPLPHAAHDIDKSLSYCFQPHYVAGQVFAPWVLGAMMAQGFRMPGTIEIMQQLINPSDDHGEGVFPWQIKVPQGRSGFAYGKLFSELATDCEHPALVLGLFRQIDDEDSSKGFVLTNPSADEEIEASDLIYVLGSVHFGAWAFSEGLMLHAPKR